MADEYCTGAQQEQCRKCGNRRSLSEFPLRKSGEKYYQSRVCRVCVNDRQNLRYAKTEDQRAGLVYRKVNAELVLVGLRVCRECEATLPLDRFRIKDGSHLCVCKSCNNAKNRAAYAKNLNGIRDRLREHGRTRRLKHGERLNEEKRAYVSKNRAKVTDRQNEWAKRKLRSDDMFALKKRIRSLISNAFASTGSQKNKETQAILGCTFDEFKIHLERQFLDGMSWDRMGSEIHIDHIIPLATATCVEDVTALNHFTNLRPMWATENIRKGARVVALL